MFSFFNFQALVKSRLIVYNERRKKEKMQINISKDKHTLPNACLYHRASRISYLITFCKNCSSKGRREGLVMLVEPVRVDFWKGGCYLSVLLMAQMFPDTATL